MLASLRDYPRVIWMMALCMVISALGESFLWPLTMTYIKETFGVPLTVASLVLLLQYSGMLLGNVVGGILFDRFGGRKIVTGAISLLVVLLIIMGLQHNFYLYIGLLFIYGCMTGTFWPSTRAFAVVLWPEGGRRGMNLLYVGNNLGVAMGAALGGLIASHSFQYAFFGNAFTYVVFLSLFLYTVRGVSDPRSERKKKEKGHAPDSAVKTPGKTWLALGYLFVGVMILVISYVQWTTTIPTYIRSLGVSLSSYSLLWALNGLVIVAFQPVLSWAIARYRLSLQAQIVIGALFFVAAMLLISVSSAYAAFCMGMFIITLGEMLVWPGVPAIAAELATEGRQGFFQGIAASGQSVGRMIGPLLGSLLYEKWSAPVMLVCLMALGLVSVLCFLVYRPRKQRVPMVTYSDTNA